MATPEESQATPRDFLAAERTHLAWIRTGMALMALGFVLARIWPVPAGIQSGAPGSAHRFLRLFALVRNGIDSRGRACQPAIAGPIPAPARDDEKWR